MTNQVPDYNIEPPAEDPMAEHWAEIETWGETTFYDDHIEGEHRTIRKVDIVDGLLGGDEGHKLGMAMINEAYFVDAAIAFREKFDELLKEKMEEAGHDYYDL